MSVKCRAICGAIEQLAPPYLAEEWDNSGLQLGDPEAEIKRVLVALDVTPEIMEQAKAEKVQMIIGHHPLIFRPLKALRTDSVPGGIIREAIKNEIVVYAAHTNLDSAGAGVNHLLAAKLGLETAVPLCSVQQEGLLKIVVFVPAGAEDGVRNAMAEAGAGWIGNYSHCFFQSAGTGTFLPGAGAKPYIGSQGTLERVDEYRLETIVRESQVKGVVAAMLAAHPYEEVAYDLYSLSNKGESLGLGRVGKLAAPLTVRALAEKVKTVLGCTAVKIAGDKAKTVSKIAVCGGSGAGLAGKALLAGAEVLVTGDVKYHEAQDAMARGLTVIDAGHFATEQLIVPALAGYLRSYAREQAWDLEIIAARERDVFDYI
ncbi:MAG TPA: Nif3-like dinuclear metal center hexameric protein [Negativicutes bacterium]|nr:Nif3-like dinuclear metal center hexameric protein [Negativicutes bacterium]